jgi:hypothetical protein
MLSYFFKTMKYLLLQISLVIAASSTSFADDQIESSATPSGCLPEITFYYNHTSQSICLNQFAPDTDSCANLEIGFVKSHGIKAHFSCNFEHKWSFDSIGYSDQSLQNSKVQVNITKDDFGNIIKMQLSLGDRKDSIPLIPELQRIRDIPEILPDTVSQSSFYICKTVLLCQNQPNKAMVDIRNHICTFALKREPVYNYPELKMFHCGRAVHIPTSESVRMKGLYMNEYHILTPYELTYEKPKKEIVRRVLKQRQKKVRKHLFKIKPL